MLPNKPSKLPNRFDTISCAQRTRVRVWRAVSPTFHSRDLFRLPPASSGHLTPCEAMLGIAGMSWELPLPAAAAAASCPSQAGALPVACRVWHLPALPRLRLAFHARCPFGQLQTCGLSSRCVLGRVVEGQSTSATRRPR